MENGDFKMENEKEKFKKEFISRLIRFTVAILKFVQQLRENRFLWSVIDQIIRSAASIGANVVEARASSSKKDYIKFFEIALKSANETIYWLMILKEVAGVKHMKTIEMLYQEAVEISKVLGASLLTMKGKR